MVQHSDIGTLLLRARLQIEEGQRDLALSMLEELHSDNQDQQRERNYLLAWCYTLARRWDDATGALNRVAKMPEDGGDYENCLDRERRALCFLRLGFVAVQLGRYEDAAHHYNKCLKLLQDKRINRLREQVQAQYGLGTTYLMRGQVSAAIQHYEEAIRLCSSLDNESEMANSCYGLSQAYRRAGRLIDAQLAGERALHLYEKNKLRDLEGRMHNELGHIAMQLGDLKAASDHFTDALALAISANGLEMVMVNCAALAEVRLAEKRFEDARRYCQHAEEMSERVKNPQLTGLIYLTIGKVAQVKAESKDGPQKRELLEEAVESFKRAKDDLSPTQDYSHIAELYGRWAHALEDLGQFEEAILCWKYGYEALLAATGPTWL